ncbi:hypothetical protein EV193_102473 [Herbihabitans rhizosphaerae]|uniref:Uncharacterized protein n=1 Tax=Herbihabitans rhizosphaerae TaxID=1872711 RepID=A0A4V2EU65_9PSEU|nr:hypothetical protein [Herbihabitans rhizosphaerae]RZS43493.1 hypothetical protein EV193_102473 [Herbihabitans rhizosphaerae]
MGCKRILLSSNYFPALSMSTVAGEPGAYLGMEVRPRAYDEFRAETRRRLSTSVWATGGCTSWYTHGGKVTNNWPGLMSEYRRRTRSFDVDNYHVQHEVPAQQGISA